MFAGVGVRPWKLFPDAACQDQLGNVDPSSCAASLMPQIVGALPTNVNLKLLLNLRSGLLRSIPIDEGFLSHDKSSSFFILSLLLPVMPEWP